MKILGYDFSDKNDRNMTKTRLLIVLLRIHWTMQDYENKLLTEWIR